MINKNEVSLYSKTMLINFNRNRQYIQ